MPIPLKNINWFLSGIMCYTYFRWLIMNSDRLILIDEDIKNKEKVIKNLLYKGYNIFTKKFAFGF